MYDLIFKYLKTIKLVISLHEPSLAQSKKITQKITFTVLGEHVILHVVSLFVLLIFFISL